MPTYYVANNGSDANPGTIGSPWSLAWAVSSSNTALQPGDTVILLDGTYTQAGTLSFTKAGTQNNPIVYRANTERGVLIDAPVSLAAGAADIAVQGVRFSYQTAETRNGGAAWSSLTRAGRQVNMLGPRQRLVQCYTDNMLNGVFAGVGNHAGVVSECYVWNNGVIGDTRNHGHGLYLQNDVANGRKLARNNVIWGSYFAGQQWYGNAANATGITAVENGQFNNLQPNILSFVEAGSNNGDLIVERNSFKGGVRFSGGIGSETIGVTMRNNTVEGGLTFFVGQQYTCTDNVVTWRTGAPFPDGILFSYLRTTPTAQPASEHTFDRNQFFRFNGTQTPFYGQEGPFSLASWRSTRGYENNGSVTDGPPTDRHFAWPSAHTFNRGHLHVWNWSGSSTASVNLRPIFGADTVPYAIYHVFDWVSGADPIAVGTYTGANVTIPMDGRQPPTPLGGATPAMMDNTFGAFVVTTRPGYPVRLNSGLG